MHRVIRNRSDHVKCAGYVLSYIFLASIEIS